MSSKNWYEQSERSNGFMLGVLCWLALRLGRTFIRYLLYPIVAYYLFTSAPARQASRSFLQRVLPYSPSWKDIFRHFYTFALVSVDRLFFLAGRLHKFNVQIEGREIVDRFADKQQGCLLLVSHLGSFDVMRVPAVKHYQLPINILMDVGHNPLAMQLINTLNPSLAAAVIDSRTPPATLALTLNEHLQQGHMIGVMADRAGAGERVRACEFLNARAQLPVGPWQLAMTLKVPVILCFGLYDGGNRYKVYFELLSEKLSASRKERELKLQQAMAHYAQRLEYYAQLKPYNWFNFYQFWSDESTADN